MSASLPDIRALALGLDANDRLELAQSLVESVLPDDHALRPAWTEEIRRRIAALEAGDADVVPAADVFAEARARFA